MPCHSAQRRSPPCAGPHTRQRATQRSSTDFEPTLIASPHPSHTFQHGSLRSSPQPDDGRYLRAYPTVSSPLLAYECQLTPQPIRPISGQRRQYPRHRWSGLHGHCRRYATVAGLQHPDPICAQGVAAVRGKSLLRLGDMLDHIDGRTDNAVLATNGFAADGKNFVKRVKQRLEVGCESLLRSA